MVGRGYTKKVVSVDRSPVVAEGPSSIVPDRRIRGPLTCGIPDTTDQQFPLDSIIPEREECNAPDHGPPPTTYRLGWAIIRRHRGYS